MAISNILKKLNHRDTKFLPRFSKISKVIIFSILAISTVFFVKNILAADNIIKQKQDAIQTGNNQESWINESLTSNIVSAQILIGGTIPDSVLTGNATSYIPGGLLGGANQIIASTFTPPASGIQYLAQIKDNFLGKPIYAADGVGFKGLSSLIPLWKVFRNMVYSISAIIFIVIGIMIMLRVKISPQAVISIQNSIPKIITTLILVTFSYAIAGLCIDLINFLQVFVLALLFNGLGKDFSENLFKPSIQSPTATLDMIRTIFGTKIFNLNNLSNTGILTFTSLLGQLIPSVMIEILGGILGAIIGTVLPLVGPGVSTIVGAGVGAILLILIVEIILVINIIKFLIGIVKCYINVIIRIIIAPLEIALGSFPSSKMGFSSWFINIIANLAVFPISVLFLVILNIIMDYVKGGLWAPSILLIDPSITGIPVVGTTMANGINNIVGGMFLPAMIGVAGVLILAKLPTMIPEFIFMIKPSPWGKAIGESFAPIGSGAVGFGKYGVDAAASAANSRFGSPGVAKDASGKDYELERTSSQKIVHGITNMWQTSRKKHS